MLQSIRQWQKSLTEVLIDKMKNVNYHKAVLTASQRKGYQLLIP